MRAPVEWLVLVASLLVWAFIVAGGHVFVPGDVCFYPKIAGEIVSGHGSTFNGITPTNGCHPLWMIVLLSVQLLVSDRETLVRAMFVLCAGLCTAALVLMARLLDRLGARHRWPALALALALLGGCLTANAAGSELHLSLPLLLLLLLRVIPLLDGEIRAGHWITAGAIAGLAMLARLDNVFFVGLAVLTAALSSRHPVRDALLIGLPAVLVVAPCLAWNRLVFGAFEPVSGIVKSTFGQVEDTACRLAPDRKSVSSLTIDSGALGVALGYSISRSGRSSGATSVPAMPRSGASMGALTGMRSARQDDSAGFPMTQNSWVLPR